MSVASVVRLETYWIFCDCGAVESITVTNFTEVRAEINELRWRLASAPLGSSSDLHGICPTCRARTDEEGDRGQ